ncbi:MAG TPA: hypothetical protein VMT46_16155 [Anaerolineaceae bacterium]|nr:hypothetical protein [Anaerolineaceae bacterium]
MSTQDVIAEMWGVVRNPHGALTRKQTIQQVGDIYARGTDRILIAIRALPDDSPMVSHLKKDLDCLRHARTKILEKLEG